MPKWRSVRIKQELVEAAKRTLERKPHRSFSKFVSDAVRLRLDKLKQRHARAQIDEAQAEYPLIHERLLYSHDHMWVAVTPEGKIRLGLSKYAQSHLEGITSIQINPVGSEVEKGKPLGIIETWMFTFDLYSPVSGRISRTNEALRGEPLLISKDPYEAGWIAEITPENLIRLEEELRGLMRPHQHKLWVSLMKALNRANMEKITRNMQESVRNASSKKLIDIILKSKHSDKMPQDLTKLILIHWQRDQLATRVGLQRLLKASIILEPEKTLSLMEELRLSEIAGILRTWNSQDRPWVQGK